ncbi:hypothetical protein HAX54_038095 [Datura stramonium]|uniref:FAD-binding domain-containing protein n=1 Tax=Datura stramonium TaxID=4076 RepID=A0ABS8SHS4_DATST|nr:hypothetical protein [Datura stramonium]
MPTSLFHRLGVRSTVFKSDSLRTSGFALALWTNAWRALDALGVGDSLRQRSLHFTRFQAFSADSGLPTAEISLDADDKPMDYDSRYKTVLRTKVLIGCDGVNSVMAKWMGLQKPVDANRSAIRGYVSTQRPIV